MERYLPDEAATLALGAALAAATPSGCRIWLHGDLGAGKTTLVRGFLHALGWRGPVRSPTYTLVESYALPGHADVHHFDLYRVADPEELEYLGARDLLDGDGISVIEWPQRGAGFLPPADLEVFLTHRPPGRAVRVLGHGERGLAVVRQLERALPA